MQQHLPVGTLLSGFRLQSITTIPELNLDLWQLIHEASGANAVHLACDDPNNLFAINFKTPPEDSTGVAHILEHTVLCGSQRFPVRDPFFSMLKRSLNTFMNAMTASDWTSYPFASQNPKDFYNLLEIYLDAAFFPLLREQDFLQEGHRLEPKDLDDPKSGLSYQGIVYNEMKGAMASLSSLVSRRTCKYLYPTTTYHFNSGGEPSDIPRLTWQQLKDFHQTHYHPGNCRFFSYGNLPLAGHLEVIQRQVLDKFDTTPRPASNVPTETSFSQPQEIEECYPVEDGETAGKTSVLLAWLTSDISDSDLRLAMTLLNTLLLGNPAAPLYRALIESRLGSNLTPGIGFHDDNRTTYFAAGLQGTEPEQTEVIKELILKTLEQVATTGFPAERVAGALHRLEFSSREVTGDSYPYPLILLMRMLGPWLHTDDPLSPLQLQQQLDRLKQSLTDPGYLPGLIRSQLLENPHRITLTLKPDPEQAGREEQELQLRLAAIAAGLTDTERQALAEQALELKKSQEAPVDLSCLPTLSRSDIPEQEVAVASEQAEQHTHFSQPTNGIVYFTGHFDIRALSADETRYVPLLGALITQIGAAGFNHLEMAERIEAGTGGVSGGNEILELPDDATSFSASFVLKGKALRANTGKLFGILADLCTAPDFSDLNRLHTVLGQLRSSLENSIPGSGHSYAARAAAAQLSRCARQRERWSGFSQVRLIKELAAKTPEQLQPLADQLAQMAAKLFSNSNLRCALAADCDDPETTRQLLQFRQALGESTPKTKTAAAELGTEAVPGGFSFSVPVSYVARVFPTVSFSHPDAAPLTVLAKLMRAGFLHREIREKGGAYGGLANYDAEGGLFAMLSYRDPQLKRTLDVYQQAIDWAVAGEFSDQDVEEAVLAAFSDLDRPLSPAGRASREFSNQLQGLNLQLRQSYRQRLLAVVKTDLIRVAKEYLQGKPGAIAVLSSKEKLEAANRELEQPLTIQAV